VDLGRTAGGEYARPVTDPASDTHGETLEQLLERVVFEDPATHSLRDRWEEAKRAEQETFDRICRAEYDHRLEYHRVLGTPDPEAAARREAALSAILFREELDRRLAGRWADILREVDAILESKKNPG
jgi:hypothetical protein